MTVGSSGEAVAGHESKEGNAALLQVLKNSQSQRLVEGLSGWGQASRRARISSHVFDNCRLVYLHKLSTSNQKDVDA
jgi:hypothetical protein